MLQSYVDEYIINVSVSPYFKYHNSYNEYDEEKESSYNEFFFCYKSVD